LAPSRFGTRCCRRISIRRRLPAIVLSRLDHAAVALPVYASQLGSPRGHATLGSGWWLAFPGQGSPPCRVRPRGFCSCVHPPLPGFAWRTCRSLSASNRRNSITCTVRPERGPNGVRPDVEGPHAGADGADGAVLRRRARWRSPSLRTNGISCDPDRLRLSDRHCP